MGTVQPKEEIIMETKKEIPRPKKLIPGQRPTPEAIARITKGRTWAEMANDLEKEQDAKAEKLYTPEYRKMWEEAGKMAELEGDE